MKPKFFLVLVIIFTSLALTFSALGAAPAGATNAQPGTTSSAAGLDLPLAYDATQISSGWYHTCALTTNGTIKCWGRNDDGELGNNTWADSHIWVDVWTGAGNSTPLSGVVAITAGSYHTCALTTSGGVKCWGYNSYGQLGNNSWSSSPVPVDVNGLTSGVVAIAAGNSDTCALTTSGGVKCWGYNNFGELGNNSTVNSNVPVDVTGLASGVQAIAAGGYHTCALTTAGHVKCWGYNNAGQIGDNTWTNYLIPVDVVTSASDSTPLSGIRAIAGGTYHTCGVTTAGGVKCWGYNNYGQLGRNSYWSSNVPVDVVTSAGDSTPLSGINAITAGENHTCAVTATGGLKCWGSSEQDQMGSSSTTPVPVDMSNLTAGVSAAAAGRYHTCVVTTDGGVKCVGYNAYGELGNNSTTNSKYPVDVSGLGSGGAIAIASGYYYSCGVTSNGIAKCWGRNDYGQLGNNTTTESHAPVDVWTGAGNSTPLSGVRAISVNYQHSCALTTAGGVKCWGYNSYGQLGNGIGATSYVPVDVTGLTSGVSAMGVGEFHTCALTTSGGVKCWGNNQYGQLGNNSTTTSGTPVDVTGLTSGVSAIAVGSNYTCALTTAGGVRCWGRNNFGQLGDNTWTESHVPVDVTGLTSGVSAITGGLYHACAVTTSGGGKCWGWNFYGQLGNDSTTTSNVPVDITGLTSGVSALAAGAFNTCALTTSGGARCWGDNTKGQVGDNSTTERHAPVAVSGLTAGVSAITVGYEHACALTTGGGAKCWGDNGAGGLGNNSTTTSYLPVQVNGLLSSALPIVHLAANPVQAGDAVSFAATVSGPPVDTLSGTVQFQVDGAVLGSAVSLSSGSATSPSTTGLALGLHRITAIYSGNSDYNLSRSASVVQAVVISTNADLNNLALSDGTLTPAFVSATTAYTATVTNNVTSITITPTAANTNATLTVNGATVASGNASAPIALNIGANTITTIVTAQDGITTKTYTVTVTRLLINTTTSVTSSSNPSILGQAITLTAQVSPTPTGGTIAFNDNGTNIAGCAAQPLDGSGQATCTTSALALGSHTITAFFSGNTNYNASDNTASPLTQTVNCFSASTVSNNADSGAGSLRQAMVSLCSGGAITFNGNYTIPLGSPLTIDKNMTIDGTGRSITLSGDSDGDGDGDVRVFYVQNSVAATLAHLSIISGTVGGGYTCTSNNCGGGIYNLGTLTVTASTLADNSALYGGGISNLGTLTVLASTIANNYAGYGGGGIYNQGTLTVQTSTLVGNSTDYSGGGIYNNHGNLTVQTSTLANNRAGSGGGIANDSGTALKVYNSTLSGNRAGNSGGGILNYGTWLDLSQTIIANSLEGGDCIHISGGGGWVSSGYSLIESTGANACGLNNDYFTVLGVDPLLGPLGDYGGSTQTFALLPGSSAINTGWSTGCAPDQRGVTRPQGSACDIGAFESQGFTLAKTGGDAQSALVNTAFANPLVVSITANNPFELVAGGVLSFTAPTSGASIAAPTSFVRNINAGGVISATVTANGTIGGPYNVTASATGANSVNFSLTNESTPAAPSGLNASPVSQTQINLSWIDNSSNETGFKIYRDSALITTTPPNVTTYSDTGLACGTSYTYEVRATNASGDSASTTDSAVTVVCAPVAPVVVTPANGSLTNDSTPTISGTAEFSSTVTVTIDDASIGTTTADASGNWSYSVGSALSNGSHTVKATAHNAGGTSPDSNTNTFTVDATAPRVTSITRLDANPTGLAGVRFLVRFSEAVSGVEATSPFSDFSPAASGLSGAIVTGVSGSGVAYTVTVATGSGNGTLRLNMADDDTILDAAGNPLGGVGAGNGNFTTGESYTVQRSLLPGIIASANPVDEGTTVTFTGSFSYPMLAPQAGEAVSWDFGDGYSAVGVLNPTHTYGQSGLFTVTLTVTDTNGIVGVSSLPLTVNNVAPAVDAGPGGTRLTGIPFAFHGSYTDPGWLETHTITWSFGDGSLSFGSLTPSHSYATPGTYTATLTITDSKGGVGMDTTVVNVMNQIVIIDPGDEWSDPITSTTPCGNTFIGEFGSQSVTLTLQSLPAHTLVTVSFDLFIIRSWDGNRVNNLPALDASPYTPDSIVGPDIWQFQAAGNTLLHTTFSNWTGNSDAPQAYPGSYPGGSYPAQTGASAINSLCYTYGPYDMSSVYQLQYTFAHTGDALVLDFAAMGLQAISDESWGLDNVKVSISADEEKPYTLYLPIIVR